MKHKQHLLGNVPKHTSGPNIGKLNRDLYASQLGLSKKQVHKAYNNWTQAFRIPETTLTFEQYIHKMFEAGITPDDIRNGDGYNLSRYNDEGPYTNESCRFIPAHENSKETKRASVYRSTLRKYGELQTKKFCAEGGKARWDR